MHKIRWKLTQSLLLAIVCTPSVSTAQVKASPVWITATTESKLDKFFAEYAKPASPG